MMAVTVFAVQRSQAQFDLPPAPPGYSTGQFHVGSPEAPISTDNKVESSTFSEHVGDLQSFAFGLAWQCSLCRWLALMAAP
jgi:hypothetical protein